jgi:hypothetical protein
MQETWGLRLDPGSRPTWWQFPPVHPGKALAGLDRLATSRRRLLFGFELEGVGVGPDYQVAGA